MLSAFPAPSSPERNIIELPGSLQLTAVHLLIPDFLLNFSQVVLNREGHSENADVEVFTSSGVLNMQDVIWINVAAEQPCCNLAGSSLAKFVLFVPSPDW